MRRTLPVFIWLMLMTVSMNTVAQKGDTLVYTDYNLADRTPSGASFISRLDSGNKFIRIDERKETIEVGKMYSYGSHVTRKAKWVNTSYGSVLAFKEMKTPGYECVIIFCDKDYYNDSLLVVKDTVFFKEMCDDLVELSMVYPAGKDTLMVKQGIRNTRHDFLKDIKYNPAMKSHARWFLQNMLDREYTFVLVKKGDGYEIVSVVTDWDKLSDYDKQRLLLKFRHAGPSIFWVAMEQFSYR
ncbi:MAG: hypothetical protein JNM88_14765 [Chitinophagaceae bacterium]|nr:hypothetical protein [Chitinophagaceae bacterium]